MAGCYPTQKATTLAVHGSTPSSRGRSAYMTHADPRAQAHGPHSCYMAFSLPACTCGLVGRALCLVDGGREGSAWFTGGCAQRADTTRSGQLPRDGASLGRP